MVSNLPGIRSKIWRQFIIHVLPIKTNLPQDKVTEIESIDFVRCYVTLLKDDIYGVTIIGIEISMHIQIFIPVKASFFPQPV